MKNRIKQSFAWFAWSRGAIQAITLGSTLFVMRTLSPSDYGLVAITGIWTSIFSLLLEMGIGATIIQFRNVSARELNTCFYFVSALSLVSYAILFLLAPGIARWFDTPEIVSVIRVLALTLPMGALRVIPDALLRKRLALENVSRIELFSAAIGVPVVIGLAVNGAGVWALVGVSLVTQFVQTSATLYVAGWCPGWQIGGHQLKKLFRYGTTTLGTRLCWTLYMQADTFVLAKVGGDAAVGLYSIAKQLATLLVEKLGPFIAQLTVPYMAQMQDDLEALRQAFLKSVRLVTFIAFPFSLSLIVIRYDVVALVLAPKWAEAAPLLMPLSIFAALSAISILVSPVLMARNRLSVQLLYTLLQLIVMPAAFWVGANNAGSIGLAWCWVMIYPWLLAWYVNDALVELKLSWYKLLKAVWPPLLASIVMSSLMELTMSLRPAAYESSIQWLLLTMVVGAVGFATALIVIRKTVLSEVRDVTGWLFGRAVVGGKSMSA